MVARTYLKSGVVPVAAVATVVLAVLRAVHVLVPSWWAVGLPVLVVLCAYVQARAEHWVARRAAQRNGEKGT